MTGIFWDLILLNNPPTLESIMNMVIKKPYGEWKKLFGKNPPHQLYK